MDLPEIVDVARNFAVLIRVQGPDPKGLKMRKHAFHLYNSGRTTLSASGFLLPSSSSRNGDSNPLTVVVTVASVVEPFLSIQHRNTTSQGKPELVPGVQIDVMTEGKKGLDDKAPHWLSAELLAMVDVSASSTAVKSLIQASVGSSEGWEVGWSLVLNSKDPLDLVNATQTQGQMGIGWSTTKIAFLGLSTTMSKDHIPNLSISSSVKRGDLLLAIGSPFGALSPAHFYNSISEGFVSNRHPCNSDLTSLLIADIRCLPGMEGGPVFGKDASLVGMLTRPLRQKTSGAEIQLVIPWEAIASSCSDLLQGNLYTAEKLLLSSTVGLSKATSIDKVVGSVCLITIDEGVWASGVLLNEKGLILTNAHLLEPWRFQKTTLNSDFIEGYKFNWTTMHRRIRVRLDHIEPWIWCEAKVVYVCKGPIDVALLQLVSVPGQLRPIAVNLTCPKLGSEVYVIGHGLFGPRSEISPSASAGVVAKIVEMNDHFPAMIETTAAVHPGGSGGAVVDSSGHLIGLVTSNARHGGGKTMPHLNFSIPCSVLEPIFRFSKDMQDLSPLEDIDKPNEQLSSVWALAPPGTSLPDIPRPLPFDAKKEGKGSRFAKFIEEKQDFFGGRKFPPSKL